MCSVMPRSYHRFPHAYVLFVCMFVCSPWPSETFSFPRRAKPNKPVNNLFGPATSSAFTVGHRESGGSVRPVISHIKYEAITYGGLWCTNSPRQKGGGRSARILTAAASLYERAAAYVS